MGEYQTIVADPPWDQGRTSSFAKGVGLPSGPNYQPHAPRPDGVGELPYEPMTLAEIEALPVRKVAADDAHLYLWTTDKFLRDAFRVAESWGFQHSRTILWCKKPHGIKLGGAWPATVEFVLFCRRGSLAHIGDADKSWFEWPRRRGAPVRKGERRNKMHSAKPEAFQDIVEEVSPGPYLELFARRERLGWETWGNQSANSACLDLAAA